MSVNRGKAFEDSFKEDWKKSFPNTVVFRLYDVTNGFTNISYPCDFITFEQDKLFFVECKSHAKLSMPFSEIPQYPRLLKYKGKKNVYPGILIWFKDKDKIIWVPIEEAEKIYLSGEKSIGLRHLKKYHILDLEGEKKRVFLTCDYQKLIDFVKE